MARDYTLTRTWTFAEDEGGATVLEANDHYLTAARYSGPDCDGTTSERHYEFVQRADDCEFPDGTYDNRGYARGESDAVYVLCDNPQRAFDDWLDIELGSMLRAHYLTGQPDDHND